MKLQNTKILESSHFYTKTWNANSTTRQTNTIPPQDVPPKLGPGKQYAAVPNPAHEVARTSLKT